MASTQLRSSVSSMLGQWLLLAALGGICGLCPVGAYSSGQLLDWMQQSNFGYQVLHQAIVENQTSASEVACLAEVRLLLLAAEAKALPALRVLDAWGKFPHGLLYGHFTDMGNYESCLNSGGPIGSRSTTKYCLTSIQFESLLLESMGSNALTLRIGTCIPSACSAAQLNRWINDYLQKMFGQDPDPGSPDTGVTLVQENNCAVDQRERMTGLDWFAVAVLVVLAILVFLATLLDRAKASNKLLSSFSLRQNLPQHVMPCLNGIRCLTIIWIIFGHGYMFLLLAPSVNAYEIIAWAQTPFSMVLQSGTISVDTFFLLSGLLLVMSALREMERNSGRLHVPLMYLHRVVRLTPVLALAVLIFMTLFPRLDSGPLWQQFTASSQLCSDTWWATLLYVQNYAAPGRMCLGHSWYLAVDMQLYILSPLLLIALYKWGRKAAGAIILLILLLFACVFSIIMLNQLQVFSRNGNLGEDSPQMRLIYYTTHARAMPWLIGLLFGYYLHSEGSRRRRLSKWLALVLWIVALSLFATVIFAVYPYTQSGAKGISPLAGAFFLCCGRIAWPLSLCWLIWACQNGLAPVVNSLLSWSLWQPLSRLSYCLYIWHLMVETANVARSKSSLHFSNYDAILRFWSDFGITLCVSTLMYLFVEAPVARLEAQLLRLRRSPRHATRSPTTGVDASPSPDTAPATSISRQNLVVP
ncbi:nose resistant to fluoxetine protein 6 isoform X2 [Drosophila obscura]|uniref:nose resistant to fluoxetine protein 6 isoform X2 n=1 Tax=Drosophila obscura TaxID=7282 RepID=UPI001BB15935|nr:nose resistant to fluoxetine protein 6 isoform X2 [Drosophila obscura]